MYAKVEDCKVTAVFMMHDSVVHLLAEFLRLTHFDVVVCWILIHIPCVGLGDLVEHVSITIFNQAHQLILGNITIDLLFRVSARNIVEFKGQARIAGSGNGSDGSDVKLHTAAFLHANHPPLGSHRVRCQTITALLDVGTCPWPG